MSRFKVKDTFTMFKIIKKLDLKSKVDNTKNVEEVGKDIFFYILENMDRVQDEISELIVSVFEVSKDEALDMPLDKLIDEFKNIGGIADFFQSVGKLTK